MSGESNPVAPGIPRMEYREFLGAGGHADVFLYQDKELNRLVAVKILRETDDDEASSRFHDEFEIQSSLSDHRNIARVIRKSTVQDRPYSAMDYYPGLSLAVEVKHAPLPVAKVLKIGVKIAGALETAHRRQILHRDIKPANILLDSIGEPFLTDFGIAATQIDVVGSEQSWMSLEWTAPEVVAGKSADARADVYSLAATLYHLLAGQSPFSVPGGDNSERALEQRIVAGALPPTGRRDVPAALEALLSRSMATQPVDRPATEILLAEGLQAIERSLGLAVTEVSVQPPQPVRQLPVPRPAAATLAPARVDQGSTLRRGAPRELPDPARIHTRAELAEGLVRLAEASGRSHAVVAARAGQHAGIRLGSVGRIRRSLARAGRNKVLPERDFVTGFVRGCHCDTATGACTGDCSARQLGPWLQAWERVAAAPSGGRRLRWLVVAAVVVAIGAGIGIYLAAQHKQLPGSGQPAAETAPPLYRVQASLVYRPDTETATVRWNSDIASAEGFEGFLVIKWVDGKPEPVGGQLPKDRSSLAVPDVPRNRNVCFEVIAYGVNRPQTEAPPKPCNNNDSTVVQQTTR